MLLGENILLALRSLKANKMRAFLTMLGIIIGIASVIAIFTVGNSLTRSVSENMQTMGANDVFVTVTSKEKKKDEGKEEVDGLHFPEETSSSGASEEDYLTADMIHALARDFSDDIYGIAAQMEVGSGEAAFGREETSVSLSGVSAGFFLTTPVEIRGGSMFTERDWGSDRKVCLISKGTAEKLYGGVKEAVGSTIGIRIKGETNAFTIRGVYEKKELSGSSSSMNMMSLFTGAPVYIPLKTAAALSHRQEAFPFVQVITGVGVDSKDLSDRITRYFEPMYRNHEGASVRAVTLKEMVKMLEKLLDTITTAISIIAGIALLVGGIGVMNIMLVSVTERTREIGTRKALGARNSSIRIQFIVEALVICLIGGAIGLILGMVLGTLASDFLGYPAAPSIPGILISIAFSVGIGLFFGYFPANKAAKMNPIDALRYE